MAEPGEERPAGRMSVASPDTGSDSVRMICRIEGPSVTVRVVGELDLYTSPMFAAELGRATATLGPSTWVRLDCSEVRVIGCSGLAVIAEAARCLRQRGVTLTVEPSGTPNVRRALSLLPLETPAPTGGAV